MKKNRIGYWMIIICLLLTTVACEETETAADALADWATKNETFLTTIAQEAKAKPGEWKIIKSWTLVPDATEGVYGDLQDYVYVKVLKEGTGTELALYSDSVNINYKGKLYNDVVFDSSYSIDEPDRDLVQPVGMQIASTINGFATALQHMKEGDRWLIYIPWSLGYGSSAESTIPGYSNLIFDIDLVKIIHK